jgi:thiol-disulfide isomerase/thioredoxin
MHGRDNRARAISAPVDWVPTVTGETFAALVLNGHGPIVVEFMSYACAHCAEVDPVLKEIGESLQFEQQSFRVNTRTERALTDHYQISRTPTLVMFLDGAEVGRSEDPPSDRSRLMTVVTAPFASWRNADERVRFAYGLIA